MNKYYFLYKCYWSHCRSDNCEFYFNILSNYRDNKETVKSNKKKKNTIKLLIFLDSTKLKMVWKKLTTFCKRRVSIIP